MRPESPTITGWKDQLTRLGQLVLEGTLAVPLAPAEAFLLARYGPLPDDAHPLDEAEYDPAAFAALSNARLIHAGHPSWHLAHREGDRLGEILFYRGWLTPGQVEDALHRGGLIGEALLELGYLRAGQIQLALQWQKRYRTRPAPAPAREPYPTLLEAVLVEPDPRLPYEAALAALDATIPDHGPQWYVEAARRGNGLALGVIAHRELEFLPRVRNFPEPNIVAPLEVAVMRAVATAILKTAEFAPTLGGEPGPGNAPTLGGSP